MLLPSDTSSVSTVLAAGTGWDRALNKIPGNTGGTIRTFSTSVCPAAAGKCLSQHARKSPPCRQISHFFLLEVFGMCLWCPAVTQFFGIHECGSWIDAAYEKLCKHPDRSPGTLSNVCLPLHILYSDHAWCAVSCEAGPPLKLISDHFEGGEDVRCWPESLGGGRILLDHSTYSSLLLPELPIAPMHTERLTRGRRSQFSGNGWSREVRRWRNRNQTCPRRKHHTSMGRE